jgi:hypothetical protein
VRLSADLRGYGEIRGLSRDAWTRLALDCPLEGADWAEGVLTLEHEGRWVDAMPFLEELARAMAPDGDGHADIIDNEAWTITRCRVCPGNLDCQEFGLNDVLENTVAEGNI